jgi:tetratricopeptide (TPR) repeat protein
VSDGAIISRLRREVDADASSMRFVPLAEALRKAGMVYEAEAVLARGLDVHPGLNSARLVYARLLADTERIDEALEALDELYPRDAGNVALVTLYLNLLVEVGRHDEARVLLDRAELVGVPETQREQIAMRLEAALWADSAAGQASLVDETWPPMDPSPAPSATAQSEAGDNARDERGSDFDLFCTPVVALRLERGGRLDAALRVWRVLSSEDPRRADLAAKVADVQFRLESGAETLQAGFLEPVDTTRPPHPKALATLLRLRRAFAVDTP